MVQLVVGQLLNGVIVGTLYGIIALGVTLTFGITGIVNFALGAFMAIGAYLGWYLTDEIGIAYPLAVPIAVVGTALFGLVADQLLFRFTRNNLINGLIVSIGLISVIQSVLLMLWTTTPKNMHYVLPGVLNLDWFIVPKMKGVVFLVLLVVILSTYAALTRTWAGRAAYAFAQAPEAATLMGVRTRLLQTGVVVYSTALAGLGGALYASLYSLEVSLGSSYILKGVEAAILAGIGSVMGSLGRRHRARCHRSGRLALFSAGLSRCLWLGVPGADPAAAAGRFVRRPPMRAELLWLPLFAVPLVFHNEVALTILIFTFILGILAVSFNLIFGYTGQLSMFHAAAFGIAAYATHLSMAHLGVSFWIGALIAILIVTGISLVVGTICFRFRLKEFYFAIVTLAFSEIARLIILNWSSFTNGTLGINLTDKPMLWIPGSGLVPVEGTRMWYYLSLVALILSVFVCTRVVHSWMGRCFAAIRLNDELADTLGINVFRYKLTSFLIGNAGAAVAGALYAYYISYVEPDYLSIEQSLAIIAMVLLGGRQPVAGPIIGALVLTALPHVIEFSAEMRILVYGLILILTILLMPRGIMGVLTGRRHVL